MLAALITGKDTVELTEFPDPTPAPAGVVVDIAFCGICGTDVHAYQSGRPYNPAICGHEWSGTVSAVGSEVRDIGEGDRVVVLGGTRQFASVTNMIQVRHVQVDPGAEGGVDSLPFSHGFGYGSQSIAWPGPIPVAFRHS